MREPDTTPPTSCPRCQTFLPEPTATCPICGADIGGAVVTETGSLPPEEFEVVRAALADEYDVLDELGRGGMAVVYRARERRLQRDVAIKVLPFTHTQDLTYI
jgi:serine/threonine protein kinase